MPNFSAIRRSSAKELALIFCCYTHCAIASRWTAWSRPHWSRINIGMAKSPWENFPAIIAKC